MNIAFLAHDKKKELMVQFCTAYKSVLMKHNLFATATTGRLIADNTGLPITLLLSHKQGGHQQINARIAYNEIDLVLLFTDPNTTDPWDDAQMIETIRHCDRHNVPIATNLASAEMLIMACSGAIWIGGKCCTTRPVTDNTHGREIRGTLDCRVPLCPASRDPIWRG